MQDFGVKLELDGNLAIMSMHGDLTNESKTKVINAYEKIVSAKARHILLDFSRIEYINSAGMSVLITLLTRSQEAEKDLRAFGLSPHFQKIFDMVGLLKYIPHFDDRQTALASLGKGK